MKTFELTIYWFLWISSLCYALYSFINRSKSLIQLLDPKDVAKGWPLIGGFRDVSDYEWSAIRHTFLKNFVFIVVYILLTQLITKYKVKYLSHFFIIYTSLAIIKVLNVKSLLIVWINIIVSLVIHIFGKQYLCYSLFVFTLYSVHNSLIFPVKTWLVLNERQQFLFEVCMAWLNAKCLSLSIDRIKSHTHMSLKSHQLIQCLAYCLYLPAFFTGPIHQYNTFISDMDKLKSDWTSDRLMAIVGQIFRFTFWTIIYELLLHFVFSSSVQFYPEITQMLDTWSLCGLGFALPLMFFVKYFILYGSVATIAMIDGFEIPPPPKCIARIHSCVYLWRTFDRGLHLWLTKYFYKPIIGSQWNPLRKLLAGFICFSCICLWHGMDRAVVVWTALNFFGVSAEIIGTSIQTTNIWLSLRSHISVEMNDRLNALISSPFFAIAYASNLYFLSNWDVGLCFIQRIFTSFPTPLLPTLLIMYFGCNVSAHCIQREKTK
ncbi:protein-cysteine N-palmitoyltransferase HHAT-like [Oppia nitens]|uniref:protein-cysteine N-palmitoyltransferase HHAT-like n=1 Tax=Oppia nitens TaxID=1686743 RepID=UPI0023DA1D00|nr:protein-cysteine N-palmitoyltransferase HHAT-like [Oppia nitens]